MHHSSTQSFSRHEHSWHLCLLSRQRGRAGQKGEIVAAAQEERFTRAKNTSDFPTNAIRWCLENSGLKGDQIDFVAFYDKPFLKFERLIETYFAFAPKGFTSFRTAMPIWISEKLFQKDLLLRELNAIDPGLGLASKLMFTNIISAMPPRPSIPPRSRKRQS